MNGLEMEMDTELAKMVERLSNLPSELSKSMAAAVDKTASGLKSRIYKGITERYTVGQQDLQGTRVRDFRRAFQQGYTRQISFSGLSIPLYRFNVSPLTPSVNKAKRIRALISDGGIDARWSMIFESTPVYAKVLRSEPKKHIRNAFIADSKGVFDVYQRQHAGGYDDEPYKLRKLMGLSTAQMAHEVVTTNDTFSTAIKTILNMNIEEQITKAMMKRW
ncbi:hypothetical protein FACS189425_09280 [Clostridia bacterium]|nr:hypothetical protein FACS189425_09280 [Clostridia bacterium]